MYWIKRKKILMVLIATILLMIMTGCADKSNPAEDMYVHLERAVEIENTFEEQQEPLVNFEEKEHELYEEMILLGLSELEKIKEIADKAISYAEQRRELISIEKESVDDAYEEFLLIKGFIEEIEDEAIRDKAEAMVEAMNQRYNIYQDLYEHYSKSITLDKELYEMLQDEELLIEQLEEQIDAINEKYNQILKIKDEFNNYTKKYNDLKRNFYDIANVEVKYAEES